MRRGAWWVLLVVVALGTARFGWYAQERRKDRASYELTKLVTSLREDFAPRPPHVEPPTPGSFAEVFAREPTLAASRAASGELPNGFPPPQLEAPLMAADGRELTTCLDALAFARDIARGGGLRGVALAERGTRRLLPGCVSAIDAAPLEQKKVAEVALERIIAGTPSIKRAIELSNVDHQLALFGGLMRREDVDGLPVGLRPTAVPFDWKDTVGVANRWGKVSKTWERIADTLELSPQLRTEAVKRLQPSLEGDRYPDVAAMIDAQDERLRWLRFIRLVARQEIARAEKGAWPQLTEVELGEVKLGQSSGAERELIGPAGAVTLHAEAM